MKIVGWTEWDDPRYREMFPLGGTYKEAEIKAVRSVIAKELRNNGYKFTGSYHQDGDYGVPVFDSGEVFQCSQRMWGGIMAEAYSDEIDNSDNLGYTVWAWIPPEPMVVPNMKV
ncbi:MAG: hypothetical protein IKK89_11360 [Alistipes sp.]|jgi:hypothetical protein|nr:hypothetical protein [Alistipes sp.]